MINTCFQKVNTMTDLKRFELFTIVAKLGSLTKAASSLSINKAALSKQIKKLEQELSVDLFSRKGQRLSLTHEGDVLLQQCLKLQLEIDNTRALCSEFFSAPKGDLHVVILDYFAKKFIYPHLAAFKQQYPEVNLFFDVSERIPDFENEVADLAVGFFLVAPENLIQRRMYSTRYVMCSAKSYFDSHGIPEKLEDLMNHIYIGHASRDEICSTHLQPGYHLKLKPSIIFNNVSGMIASAKLGIGIVQLPLYLVENEITSGQLIEVLTDYQLQDAPVFYFYPKYRHSQPKVRCFIDFFLADKK